MSGGTLLTAGELIAGNISALGTGALTVGANAAGTTLDNAPAATSLAQCDHLESIGQSDGGGKQSADAHGPDFRRWRIDEEHGASTLIPDPPTTAMRGGTRINTGTLQESATAVPQASVAGPGPVLDDAGLVFNRSGTVAVPGAITGTGSLTQEGVAGGTLVLTGDQYLCGGRNDDSDRLQGCWQLGRRRFSGQHLEQT